MFQALVHGVILIETKIKVKGSAYNKKLFAIAGGFDTIATLTKEIDMYAKDLFMLHDALLDIGRAMDSSSWGPPAAENPNEDWDSPEKEYEVLCDDGVVEIISARSAKEAFEQAKEWQMKPVEVFEL